MHTKPTVLVLQFRRQGYAGTGTWKTQKKTTFLHQNETNGNISYVSVQPRTSTNSSCQYRGSTLRLLTAGGAQLTWIQYTKERGTTKNPLKIHSAGFLVSTCTVQSASIQRACSDWDCPCCPIYTRGKTS